jgi:hypothetical protein
MTQSSRRSGHLPAWLALIVGVAAPARVLGQDQHYRVTRQTTFRQEAGTQGKQLIAIPAGAIITGGTASNGWVQVLLDGWIWSGSVGKTSRDGHTLGVTSGRGENIRTTPNGSIIARLPAGFLLDEISRDRGWVRARRSGWVSETSLSAVGDTAVRSVAAPDDTSSHAATSVAGGSTLDRAVLARESELLVAPDGQHAGALSADQPVRVLARSGEWVRVQAEGWIREADIRPTAPGLVAGLTAAELRTRPEQYEGKLVQWTLQFLSLATADELRPEIPVGHRYMLARGPLPEAGFVYVTLSSEQEHSAEQLPPLAQIVVVARIRSGRTRYLGNPVVDLVELRVRQL